MSRFTVLFGMGRRGTNSLWPPNIKLVVTFDCVRYSSRVLCSLLCIAVQATWKCVMVGWKPTLQIRNNGIPAIRYSQIKKPNQLTVMNVSFNTSLTANFIHFQTVIYPNYPFRQPEIVKSLSNDRVKPHEQLVSVSFKCYHSSTPDLSTLSSLTTLQRGYTTREVSSSGEFHA